MCLGRPKGPTFRLISTILVFSFMTSFVMPKDALAARSRAGGGDVPEFSFSDFATTAGMSLGMFIAGQAIGGALSSGFGDLWSAAKSGLGFGEQASSLSSIMETAMNSPATGAWVGTSSIMESLPSVYEGGAEGIAAFMDTIEQAPAMAENYGSTAEFLTEVVDSASTVTNIISPATSNSSNLFSGVGTFSKMANAFTSPFSSVDKFGLTMIKGYNTFMATSQVARAIGAMGAYAEWNPRRTFVLSAISTGLVAGFLNPDIALAKQSMDSAVTSSILNPPIDTGSLLNMTKGAFVGGLQQGASSLVVVAIDGSKLSQGKSPGAIAQLSGLIAGTAAGNFARELVNPSAQLLRAYKIEDQGNQGKSYAEITQVRDGYKMTEPYLTPSSSREEAMDFIRGQENDFGSSNIKAIPDNGILRVYNIDPGITASGLAKATFINTLDMWPVFAGKGMGYLAANMLGNGLTDEEKNKRPLATLARGLTETAFTSIFSGAASTWGLRPSLYIGRDADVINEQINYSNSIATAAKLKRMEDYKTELDDRIEPLKEQLRNNQIDQDKYDIQVISQANELARKYGFIDSNENLPLSVSKGGISRENFVRNQAIKESGIALETLMKNDSAPHLSDQLEVAQVSKFDLFTGKVKDGLLLGLFESGVKMGVQSAFQSKARLNQQSPSYDYMEALMVSGLTNIGMGIVRGVAWNLGWEPNSANSYWYQGKELVKTRPELTRAQGNDLLASKEQEYYNADYAAKLNLYEDYLQISGAGEAPAQVGGKEVWQSKVRFTESSAPSLAAAIGMSIKQATLESFVGGFSFGIPLTRPDNVSSLQFLQYTNVLKSKASQVGNVNTGGFTRALADFAVDANLSATANSLLETTAQVKSLRDFVGIAPERLVQTNAPGIPYTLQYSQKTPGLANYDSKWYIQYPDPLASIKSRKK